MLTNIFPLAGCVSWRLCCNCISHFSAERAFTWIFVYFEPLFIRLPLCRQMIFTEILTSTIYLAQRNASAGMPADPSFFGSFVCSAIFGRAKCFCRNENIKMKWPYHLDLVRQEAVWKSVGKWKFDLWAHAGRRDFRSSVWWFRTIYKLVLPYLRVGQKV